MALSLRPTGLSSPAYRDWLDYVIVDRGPRVGRHGATKPAGRARKRNDDMAS
jgi:hypothetical protein